MTATLERKIEDYHLQSKIFETIEDDLGKVLTMVDLHGYTAIGISPINLLPNGFTKEKERVVGAIIFKEKEYWNTEGYITRHLCQVLINRDVLEPQQSGYTLYESANQSVLMSEDNSYIQNWEKRKEKMNRKRHTP